MNQIKLSPIAGAVMAVLAVLAPTSVNSAELEINGVSCGSYEQASFSRDGFLTLTGVEGCQFINDDEEKVYDDEGYDQNGYDKDGFNKEGYNRSGFNKDGFNKEGYNKSGFNKDGYDKDGYDKDGYDKNGYDKNGKHRDAIADNGVPSFCKNPSVPIARTTTDYTNIARLTAKPGSGDYVVKIVPGEGRAYGNANNFSIAGSNNMRVMAISECPGDYSENLPKTGACVAEGNAYLAIGWSSDASTPRGPVQCRLDEGKTYYLNVRNATKANLSKSTCAPGKGCDSYVDYTVLRKLP